MDNKRPSSRRSSSDPLHLSHHAADDRAPFLKERWLRYGLFSMGWVAVAGAGATVAMVLGHHARPAALRPAKPAAAKASPAKGAPGSRLRQASATVPDVSTQGEGTATEAEKPDSSGGFGQPLNHDFSGMVCFRGGAQRNYYGEGPAPRGHLKVLWRNVIGADPAAPQWNGVGWTGQPLAVEWPEEVRKHMNFLSQPGPKTEIIVGGMDSQIHFYDSETGKPSRRPLHISPQNLIKGTVSVDPRGYPLVYVGTGLNRGRSGYHVYSLTDFKELLFLPGYDSRAPRHWPAFDGNGLVYGDRLLETGENGIFYSVKLNTKWDAETGKISLNPQITRVPISSGGIESSISVFDHYGYCSDNHGMLYRIDLDNPTHVKRLRALGDDADTTPTFDTDGNFYVGIQVDNRHSAGAKGTLFKLHAPDGALVWRWDFPAQTFHGSSKIHDINGGVLSTAAVWPEGDLVFTTTAHHPRMNQGALVALDRKTGKPRWTFRMKSYTWSSPTVVDGAVIAADAAGELYVRDAATGDNLLKDADGSPVASIKLGSCVEASPLVWKGRIYIGVRGGALVCVGPAESTPEENSTTETAGQ